MTQAEARKAIMREWFALPALKRTTQDQTAAFAMAKAAKYRFRSKADRYQVIKGWLQNSLEPSH
jgi:hypothetical protein